MSVGDIVAGSVLRCLHCGAANAETRPTDTGLIRFDCARFRTQCRATTDCCIFCSHDSVPCPPIQVARATGRDPCCGGAHAPAGRSTDRLCCSTPSPWHGFDPETTHATRESRIEQGMKKDVSHHPAHVLALGDFEPAADLLKSLAHPQRLMLVCTLMNGERAVSELERELAIRQPSLSQHLGVLRDAGVIASKRRAKSVIYTVSDARVASIVDALRSAFDASGMGATRPADTSFVPVAETPQRRAAKFNPRAPDEAAFFARVRPRELA